MPGVHLKKQKEMFITSSSLAYEHATAIEILPKYTNAASKQTCKNSDVILKRILLFPKSFINVARNQRIYLKTLVRI